MHPEETLDDFAASRDRRKGQTYRCYFPLAVIVHALLEKKLGFSVEW